MRASCSSRGGPRPSTTRLRYSWTASRSIRAGIVVELVSVTEVAPHARERTQAKAAVELVRGDDHCKRVAQRAFAEAEAVGVRERAPEERVRCRGSLQVRGTRSRPARRASTPPRRRAADSRRGRRLHRTRRSSRGAGRTPRARGASAGTRGRAGRARRAPAAGGERVDRPEEPRQRLEGALVLLLLDEEPEHRLGSDERDREAVRLLARRPWASTSETPVTVCSSPEP